jgi:hypothetical protein
MTPESPIRNYWDRRLMTILLDRQDQLSDADRRRVNHLYSKRAACPVAQLPEIDRELIPIANQYVAGKRAHAGAAGTGQG